MEMVLFSGIQAAGKSTFFKERFVDTHLRINPCSTSGAPTGPSPSARRAMRSTDLEARMRQFEAALDNPVPPGFQIVVRLDGRYFTRLTKEVCQLPWKEDYERALGRLPAGHSFLVTASARPRASGRTSTKTARDRAPERACTRIEGDDD